MLEQVLAIDFISTFSPVIFGNCKVITVICQDTQHRLLLHLLFIYQKALTSVVVREYVNGLNQSEVLGLFNIIHCVLQGETNYTTYISSWRQCRKVTLSWVVRFIWQKGCHQKEPEQSQRVGPCEPDEVQQSQVWGAAVGPGPSQVCIQAGRTPGVQPCREVLGDGKLSWSQQCVLAALPAFHLHVSCCRWHYLYKLNDIETVCICTQ